MVFFVILPIQSDVELRVMLLIFILLSECTSTVSENQIVSDLPCIQLGTWRRFLVQCLDQMELASWTPLSMWIE